MAAQELDEQTLQALAAQGGSDESKESTDKDQSTETNDPTIEFKPSEEQNESNAEIKPDEGVSEDESTPDQNKEVDAKLKESGFDVDALAKELAETGTITADKIAELKTKMNPDVVDAHLARLSSELELAKLKGQTTANDEATAKIVEMNTYIYDSVGGEENFTAMATVLKAKATPEEQASIDAKLQSGNKLLVAEGMKAAVAIYNKVKGMGGNLMSGDAGNAGTEDALPHVTKEDFRGIVASDKYKTDKVYADKMDKARMATAKADKTNYGPGHYYGYRNGSRYEL